MLSHTCRPPSSSDSLVLTPRIRFIRISRPLLLLSPGNLPTTLFDIFALPSIQLFLRLTACIFLHSLHSPLIVIPILIFSASSFRLPPPITIVLLRSCLWVIMPSIRLCTSGIGVSCVCAWRTRSRTGLRSIIVWVLSEPAVVALYKRRLEGTETVQYLLSVLCNDIFNC